MFNIYNKWRELRSFCNPSNKRYKGLTLCKEWNDYKNFETWCLQNFEDGKIIHWDGLILSPESCCFMSKLDSINKKIENTSINKYGVKHFCKTDEFRDLARKNYKKPPQKIYLKNELDSINSKKQLNSLKKHGVKHTSQLELVKQKRKKTCLEKYGIETPQSLQCIKDKSIQTNIKKYGVEHHLKLESQIDKVKKTNLERYGEEWKSSTKEGRDKLRLASIKRGLATVINGKTLSEIAKEKGVSASTIHKNYKIIGMDIENYNKNQTVIESMIENILIESGFSYNKFKKIGNYFCDFLVNNLVIEANGNYWHSDIYKDKLYHRNKMQYYKSIGLTPLFFNEDEITQKRDIVKSIIFNKLGMSKRVYARNCLIKNINQSELLNFLNENHLMGSISSRGYGIYYNNILFGVMSIRRIKNGIDISRFCIKNGYNIIGGFSKLISFITKDLNPEFIQTFIDMRYGSGDYLKSMGFNKASESVSFKWVKDIECIHRMRFKGNSGYQNGYNKLWDCGQAKWLLNIR